MLIGDDVFVRGVRLRGRAAASTSTGGAICLHGPGRPRSPEIVIDEQSVVFTDGVREESRGIWPRPDRRMEPAEPPDPPGGPDDGPGRVREREPGWYEPPPSTEVAAEGVLREALTRLWEQARGRHMDGIGKLTIRLFEAGDGFRLLGSVGAVRDADKIVKIEGSYETRDDGSFRLEFEGPVSDAQPVREFFEPQLRDAKHREFQIQFDLTFRERLALAGDAPEALTESLCRFAGGAAWVAATAYGDPA